MLDQIFIDKLECFAKHGVFPEEQVLGQKFLVSATLYMNTRKAGLTDDLEQSVNYGSVCQWIAEFMSAHTFLLIETVAEQLAEGILLAFPKLEQIDIEVKKPWAPVALPLETVGVRVSRKWHTVYLGLGSNMGDKEKQLREAIDYFVQHPKCRREKVASFRQTAPVGYLEQEDFLNSAMELETLLTPEELLEEIGKIEQQLHRKREIHWGPRTIDVDILLYDSLCMHTEELTIPHKEIGNRGFVLEPLTELNPYLWHPIYRKTVTRLYAEWKEREEREE